MSHLQQESEATICAEQGSEQWEQYKASGMLVSLESAITKQQRAVELTPEGDSPMPNMLSDLGAYFYARFERLGELGDLESVLSAYRQTVQLTPDDHPDKVERLRSLASVLGIRFARRGELDDLESAILTQRRVVELTPQDHPNISARMSSLGILLNRRFERLGELDDLEGAILMQRRAAELTPEGQLDTPEQFSDLGRSFTSRYERLGDPDDLHSAISAQRRAVELTPKGHFDMLSRLDSLGRSLSSRFHLDKSQESFDAVVQCYETAFLQTTGPSSRKFSYANWWADLETAYPEFGSAASRIRAHSSVMDTIFEILWLGYSISQQYRELDLVAKRVDSAVSVAIDLGDLPQAVEWLEAGRGLIWSQILSLRTQVNNLTRSHPFLASHFQALSRQFQSMHLVQLPRYMSLNDSPLGDNSFRHCAMLAQYERCLREIRASPGFEQFLRPPKLTSLASLTEHLDGPVIFVNSFTSRGDALIISRGGVIKLVPLPELKQERVSTLRAVCMNYLHTGNIQIRKSVPHDATKARGFFRLLDRVWKWIVCPILEALDLMSSVNEQERLPHITWCPTGPLAQLPLHAAGLHPESGPSGPHAYDLAVSSYTSSLSALVRAQAGAPQPLSAPGILVIAQSSTPDLPGLPDAVEEVARLQQALSESQITSEILSENQATVPSIEGVIGQFPWVHFACHGLPDADDPTQCAFALSDGILTLAKLMEIVAQGAELAFLSACQTPSGYKEAPEESAHLAASMLAVGFKGVVGTMWSIKDTDAPLIVEAYYKKLLELRRTGAVAEGSTGAAYALHEAVKVLRERVGESSFLRWAPFMHYGV